MAEKTTAQLFTQIKKLGQEGLFQKALPLVIEVLKKDPKDIDALKCKVVCLLKLDKCKEAYHVMTTDKELQKLAMWHERAYCLYRMNKLEDALTELNNAEPSPKVDDLFAQIYYKLEQYEKSVEVYKTLIKNTLDSNSDERESNLAAALASSASFTSKPAKWFPVKTNTYELCFNAACHSLATGDYDSTESNLDKAEKLCLREFEDDEIEAKSELAPIQVMKGLYLQKCGKVKEALELYNQVLKEKHGDPQTMAVAANNIICINKDQNMFDSKKKIKIASNETVNKKLVSHQINAVTFNSCLLSFYTNQLEQFKNKSEQLKLTGSPLVPLLLATYYTKDKKWDLALEILRDSDSQEELILLTLAELLKQSKLYGECADTLKKEHSFSNNPATVGLIASLILLSSGEEKATEYLSGAFEVIRQSGNYSSDKLNTWMLDCSKFELAYNMPQKAAETLEQLLKDNPSNIKALALLIQSYSLFDAPRAQEVAQLLPDIDIPSSINLDDLEMGVGVTSGRGLRKVIKPEEEKINEANRKFETKEKKRKKKKGKLPKVLVEGGPDPERWIPRQERTYYRKKKRNRNEAMGKGSQGLSTLNKAVEASLDMSESNKKIPEEEAKPAAQPAQPAKQQAAKGKAKPKKKGKGKW